MVYDYYSRSSNELVTKKASVSVDVQVTRRNISVELKENSGIRGNELADQKLCNELFPEWN
jgi:hypothetical protein